MKLLLLGGGGQLGWALQRALAPLGPVQVLGRSNGGDLAQPAALAAAVRAAAPQVIVNAAAFTAVDQAEREPALAHTVNAQAPAALADAARALGATLVHYSSDYVYSGSGSAPHTEDEAPAPLSAYGASKAAGDAAVAASGCRHLLLRTSWVYGLLGHNFARTMLRLARERSELRVVADQIGAPTSADWLADATAHALHQLGEAPHLSGLYHASAAGETSWHGYAQHVVACARARGMALAVERITPIATADYPLPAARPLNSRLDTRRLTAAFGLQAPPWQQGVERLITELMAPAP